MLRLLFPLFSLLFACQSAGTHVADPETIILSHSIPDNDKETGTAGSDGPLQTDSLFLLKQINTVIKRATAQHFSTQYALLADLGLHSGSKRIYLVRLTDKKVVKTGLVTHGSSTTYLPVGQRQYSNVNGSLCSSLGLYKIGAAYQGQFGLAYKLVGLDADNSNAYARAIVLHSHSCVPDVETDDPICQSWGCPTVSPAFLQTISSYIDDSATPMLLSVFDSAPKE